MPVYTLCIPVVPCLAPPPPPPPPLQNKHFHFFSVRHVQNLIRPSRFRIIAARRDSRRVSAAQGGSAQPTAAVRPGAAGLRGAAASGRHPPAGAEDQGLRQRSTPGMGQSRVFIPGRPRRLPRRPRAAPGFRHRTGAHSHPKPQGADQGALPPPNIPNIL